MIVCIVSNYRKDKQESMNRFAAMLHVEYEKQGIKVFEIKPPVILGYLFKHTNSGVGKWIAYLDKWILTPFLLIGHRVRFLFKKEVYYHIADHSNAPYLFWLPKRKTLITCHDVLAIRGAFGDSAAWCKASKTGVWLQKWILYHLISAGKIGAVSNTTLNQLIELARLRKKQHHDRFWKVVYNGFNGRFYRPDVTFTTQMLEAISIKRSTYLLHVGSGLPRKNRILLIKMLLELGADFKGSIVFAGKPLEAEVRTMIDRFHLNERVRTVENPSHELLLALYAGCDAFVFPSWSEGFGWPVVEAQACGAPVIASNLQPMPEIGGSGALYAAPDRPEEFANAYRTLLDPAKREVLIDEGFNNTLRYSSIAMINSYVQLMLEDSTKPKSIPIQYIK
jgi:glycosyltransferase involved in cell wall biosynthesis